MGYGIDLGRFLHQRHLHAFSRLKLLLHALLIALQASDQTAAFDMQTQARNQLAGIDRLGDQVGGPHVESPDPLLGLLHSRLHQDRHIAFETVANGVADFETVHARHHDVEQDDIRFVGLKAFERLDAIAGIVDIAETGRFQHRADKHARRAQVIDDQNASIIGFDGSRCRRLSGLSNHVSRQDSTGMISSTFDN